MGQPLILPIWKFFDSAGLPLAGGKLYSYAAGTTTPQATYTDTTEGTPNTNPLILDANGVGVIWLGSLSYKFILQDSLGVVQWTADGIQSIPNGSVTTVKLADGSVTTQKLADGSVTTVKIADASITTAKLVDGSVIGNKIPDNSIAVTKFTGSTPIAFVDTSAPRTGDGPSAFPVKAWTAPVTIPTADTPPVGDGLCVQWSPNGKMLAVAENNSELVALYSRFGNELRKLSPGLVDPAAGATQAQALSWSPDGQYFLVSGTTGSYLYQKLGNAFAQQKWITSATYAAVAWAPNGDYVATTTVGSTNASIVKRIDVSKNSIICEWNTTAGQSIPASTDTVIKFDNAVEDNYPAGSTLGGTSWVCFAKRTNRYSVMAYIQFIEGTTAFVAPNTVELKLYKDGLFYRNLDFRIVYGTIAPNPAVTGATSVAMSADPSLAENISIVINQTHAGAVTLSTNSAKVWVSVTEAPGYDKLSSFTALSAPASQPSSATKSVAWSPDSMFVAFGTSEIQYTFTITTPTIAPTAGAQYTNNGVTFTVVSCAGTVLIAHGSGAPLASGTLTKTSGVGDATLTFSAFSNPVGVVIYQRTGDTFAKCADPTGGAPTGSVNGLAWSPDGLVLTCVHANSPFITSYSRPNTTSTTFTKIAANPATLPAGQGNACAYNSIRTKLAVAHNLTPFLTIYSIAGSGSTMTLTKDADPSVLPTGNGQSVSWTPDSQYLSHGQVGSPYVTNYKTSGAYGSAAVTFVNEVDLV